MTTKVAVVTGSNKGIGFAIVRGLCNQFKGDVYLTSRDEGRGKAAVAELEKEGLKPLYHQLDLGSEDSRKNLKEFLKEKYGGLDILVNNAGIAYKNASPAPFSEQAEVTMRTNYHDTLALCDQLFPLLREGARVVNVTSMAGMFALNKCSEELAAKLKELTTINDVTKYMENFVAGAKAGTHSDEGWPSSAYGTTKLGLTLASFIQQATLDLDSSRGDIAINACCPGYVATDMSSFKGTKTVDEGADTPLYLATLPPNTPIRGEYVSDRKIKKLK